MNEMYCWTDDKIDSCHISDMSRDQIKYALTQLSNGIFHCDNRGRIFHVDSYVRN